MEAQKAPLCRADHETRITDSIFQAAHNMKSIGYWSPEDAPSCSKPVFISHPGAIPAVRKAEKNMGALFTADSGLAEGEGRIGCAWGAGGTISTGTIPRTRPTFSALN
jgi:hypothetical protein